MDILPPTHTAMGQSAACLSAQGLYSLPCRQDQLQLLCTGNFIDHNLQTFIEASWHCRRYHSHFCTEGVQMPSLLHMCTYNVHVRTVSARQGPTFASGLGEVWSVRKNPYHPQQMGLVPCTMASFPRLCNFTIHWFTKAPSNGVLGILYM